VRHSYKGWWAAQGFFEADKYIVWSRCSIENDGLPSACASLKSLFLLVDVFHLFVAFFFSCCVDHATSDETF
jgi:hypothetical protein